MNNEKPRLWTRNFVLIIVINFLVFMNHIMLLSTFPFYIESLGGGEYRLRAAVRSLGQERPVLHLPQPADRKGR